MGALDIVVTNYRTPMDLERFCRSLLRCPPTRPWTVTIVNVSPTAGDTAVAIAMADELAMVASKVFRTTWEDNVGYARACNNAATTTTGELLVFFNADVVLQPGALEACAEALDANPSWGVLGPRQLDGRGRITHAGIFGTHHRPQHRGWMKNDSDLYGGAELAVSVSGAAYFVKRSVWDLLTACPLYQEIVPGTDGAFLPTKFYYEETFCSYHASIHGYKVMYFGRVWITHTFHASVEANHMERWAIEQMRDSKRLFVKACNHHGLEHD